MSAYLVISSWNGQQHAAKDHAEEPNRLHCVLGTELKRIPLTAKQALAPIDVLLEVFKFKGELQ
jgi:hypothetical protein